MAQVLIQSKLVLDSSGRPVGSGAQGQVFAHSDTSHTTPITVTDASGAQMTTVSTNPSSVIPDLYVDDSNLPYDWVSGDLVVPLSSVEEFVESAQASATAAQVAAQSALGAQTAAEQAASSAQSLADDAVKTVNGVGPDASGNVNVSGGAGGVSSVNGKVGTVVLGKSDLGLDSVDNTSDEAKPISAATQAALDLKANLAGTVRSVNNVNPDSSGNVNVPGGSGGVASVNGVAPDSDGNVTLVKGNLGLGNVDNTADAAKPVSTAQAAAIAVKADDSAVVHKSGAETIAGVKTFSSAPVVPNGGFPTAKVAGLDLILANLTSSISNRLQGIDERTTPVLLAGIVVMTATQYQAGTPDPSIIYLVVG